ncbi:hypothetical protein SUGI_1033810 [Cryptomeria japonica]|nr:hypothetical protein SUGI_1033810 [Cryptomeria japonica]
MFSFEEQLVNRVVDDVIKTWDRVSLEVTKLSMGMESIAKYLIQKFELYSEGGLLKSRILDISAIGKTTLGKAMFNQVYTHFDVASFVFNVHNTAEDSTCLEKFQKQIS